MRKRLCIDPGHICSTPVGPAQANVEGANKSTPYGWELEPDSAATGLGSYS